MTFTTTKGDMSRTLTIKVKVDTDDEGDDDTSAKLSISLGRIKGVAIDAAAAAGPHTWTGLLCDGSAATINYTVAPCSLGLLLVAACQDQRRQDRRSLLAQRASSDQGPRAGWPDQDLGRRENPLPFRGPDDQRVDLDPR